MSDDKKHVEPGVYDHNSPEAFKDWIEKVYGVTPVESKTRDGSFMVLVTSISGRPAIGSVDDYQDLSNVLLFDVLGYGEGAVEGPDGKPTIGGQVGPMFHMIGVVKQTLMALGSLYFFDAKSKRDLQLIHDYEEQMKHIVAHYSGIHLAKPGDMPKGGPQGIVK